MERWCDSAGVYLIKRVLARETTRLRCDELWACLDHRYNIYYLLGLDIKIVI